MSGVHGLPSQSVRLAGASSVRPSHQTSPSGRSATFVKIVLPHSVSTAVTLVDSPVPGATPKKPASGLIAQRRPSSPGRSHAMSSPSVSTRQPGIVGRSIARLVLPHADGNAAATWYGLARRVDHADEQHVLGEPALVAADHRGDAQREALLREDRVAAVAGAERPDLERVGEVHDVLLVVARPRDILLARLRAARRPSGRS